MKRLHVLFLVVAFLICWISTVISESPPNKNIEFQATQSYELASLVDTLISYENKSGLIPVENINNFNFLYKRNVDSLFIRKTKSMDFYKFHGGNIGILINNTGYSKQVQSWNDGLLQNEYIPMGVTSDLTFICPVDYAFDSVQINMLTSPVILNNLLKPVQKGNFNISKYFSGHGYDVTQLKTTGYFNYNKALWELKNKRNNKSIYMISLFTCGASGAHGSTCFILYYDLARAVSYYTEAPPNR